MIAPTHNNIIHSTKTLCRIGVCAVFDRPNGLGSAQVRLISLKSLVELVALVAFATLVGPFVGGLIVWIAGAFRENGEFELIIVLIGAYLVGGLLAALAGVIIYLLSRWRPLSFMLVVVGVLLSNVVFFGIIMFTTPWSEFFRRTFWFDLFGAAGSYGGLSLASAIVCWLIFRLLQKIKVPFAVEFGV